MSAEESAGRPIRSRVRILLGLLIGASLFLAAVPAAFAGVGLGVTPTFPTDVTVGQTGIPASLQIVNNSTPPESAEFVTLTLINLVPSCGGTTSVGDGDCPAAQADPGVFQISPTAVGEAGTACAGQTFTVTTIDAATGQVTFTPTGGPVVLSPPFTPLSVCRLDFSFSVLKAPTKPVDASPPGTVDTAQLPFARATANTSGHPGFGGGSSVIRVHLATPGLTTNATVSAPPGSPITDTAHLTASSPPGPTETGTITFTLFGPNNATCTGAPIFTSVVAVNAGAGDYTSASPPGPLAPGAYRWIAAYSGDANYVALSTACNDMNETSTVNQVQPTIVTTASAPVPVGGQISDSAVLAGGSSPTGTITFTLFGPNNATCTGVPIFTSTVAVAGNGTYPSAPFTTTAAGTYRWIAAYSGDAANLAATTACNDAGESVVVNKFTPTVVTHASAPVTLGTGATITDTATLAGGTAPTGTITFTLFGPGNSACSGAPIFTSTVPVNAGNGNYTSGAFTPLAAGPYRWIAAYSGDANNLAVTTSCNDANESVVVAPAVPTIVTQASGPVTAGSSITDTATLAGGTAPTGTITFTLFGPNNAACTGAPAFTSTVAVNAGNGNYTSMPFTATAVGTYRWIASYSGDANNAPVTTACNDANEASVVNPATPTIVTTASGTVPLGASISDTATLSGGSNPTGSIVFTVFGPNNATCTGAAAFTSTVPVSGNGAYSSGPFTPTAAGTYRFIAAYSGDANNAAKTTACNDANESVVVNKSAPTIVTTASPPVNAGGQISDSAVLAGGSNPTGTIVFTLFGPNNATCTGAAIFTSTVAVAGNGTYPSAPFTATAAGTYRWIAAYSGDANNIAVLSPCNAPSESVVVNKTPPAISTQTSAPVTLGGSISDTATLSGGTAPTGSIVFTAFGPNNATCTGAPAFTSTVPVAGNGNYPSGSFTPTAPGTYRFIAAYGGDANNLAVTTACNDANESVVVNQVAPTIVTHASGPVTAGSSITDTATLAGGTAPTGTITFTLFGPNNATCTGAPVFTSTVAVNAGNGDYTSMPFPATAVGTYRWIASYSGDANNAAVATACNDANEASVVNPATPTIVTTASPTVALGGQISDTATLSGGSNPTGSIVFTVFGPNNATCTGVAAFTSTVTVSGNGSYPSGPFTPTAAGTYRFIAAYSGDANNAAKTTVCNDANESVVVNKSAPTIVTTASPAVNAGGQISDSAVLAGGSNPTGTIVFTLFGPNNATCTGAAIFTSTVAVAGNGTYPSAPFTATAAGTYRWIAAYSGDANNIAVLSPCNAPSESVVVNKTPPAISTQTSAPVTLGGSVTDTATLSGGTAPTGSIVFTAFGPGNSSCTGVPAFTSTIPVAGNGNYTSGSFTPAAPGTYRFIAAYSGDANNAAVTTSCNDANESVVVNQVAPTIVTHASGPVTAGSSITDTATLAGGTAPTGTITFTLFGPNNATCTGAPVFTSTVVVNAGNGNYTSMPFTATAVGAYRWVAAYSGDTNNAAVTTACNDANETSVVNPATPAIVTTASPPVALGGQISDTATLSGGSNPTGSIVFTVFGPNNATCTGAAAFTSTVTVSGNGSYPSGPFVPTAAGTYRFIAAYSGDANNAAKTTACNDANESVVVNKAGPTIVTTASPAVNAGGQISDSAVLAGGSNPTGTIVFTLFGPNNATCTGAAIFTSTVAVAGNGTYPSAPFTASAAGTYRWIAAYSGDANNNAVLSPCNAPSESVVVNKVTPTVVTQASPTVKLGTGATITDTATLAGGTTPTGTITFTLFGPNNSSCSGAASFTSTVPVNAGNGNYTSGAFTPTAAGTYRWIAAYSGDANNAAVTTSCNDANESVVVAPATPTIVTNASGPVTAGGSITDTATLAGGTAPTGTITFTLFGPNNATCAGAPIFSSTVNVNAGNGNYTSGAFTTTAAGSYRWVAAYSGDANNAALTTTCNDANETSVVNPATPTIVTTASPTVALGGQISDTATLSGGSNPTGSIVFTVFGPDNATCAGVAAFTSTVTVSGNGSYPSGPFTPTAAGTYRFIAAYSGDASNAPKTTACNDANESAVVGKVGPTIVTTASPAVNAGGQISDSAVLAGGSNPTGTIVFTLFGPNNATCTGAAIFTSTVAVAGNGTYPSAPFTASAAGTYRWIAAYSGDANNNAVLSPCNAPSESVVVNKIPPAISTKAVSPVTAGAPITDTATLSGGQTPTGTITFTLFGPNNATCTGAPIFTNTVTVNAGNGDYTSGPFTPTTAGAYRWIAAYSGDANNAAVATPCNDTGETSTVNPATPTIVTTASASVAVGGSISDSAVLAGATAPTGTITFTVFGPNNATCTGVPAFTSTTAVAGNGTYTSASFLTAAAGTYRFIATYNGDVNNIAVATACGDPAEQVVVTKATVTLTTAATVAPSGTFSDTATLSAPPAGAATPTGTVTFNVYKPGDTTCAGPLAFSSTNAVNLAGTSATSDSFRASAASGGAGVYRFTATYNGDANYPPATSACNAANESVTIPAPVIHVTKVANPLTKVEPGGTFTFTVQVDNPSAVDPITITTLTDNIYGDLATRPGSTCGTLIGVTLQPGATSAPCHFTGDFTGTAGQSQTDIVTVNGVDANGLTATSTANAIVTLTPQPPQIAVTKAAAPPTQVEPDGTFTFTVQVSNPSTLQPVTITKLVDNIYGDLATRAGSTCGALIGTTLAPGATSAPCHFTGNFHGRAGDTQTDTVTVTGVNNGTTVTATAMATVGLTPQPPQIAVTKAAAPPSQVEPGGTFTFTVQVSNPSTLEPVTITKLIDNIYGDLATRAGSTCGTLIGTTLAPGATSPSCTFTGPFNGKAGDSQTDTVTVTGINNGTTVTATAMATVTLTPLTPPQIAVTKAAAPPSQVEPGGTFTFTVAVSNPSTVNPVTITKLIDNIYGDLSTRAGSTCGTLIGTTLAPGATSPSCTFTGPFNGKAGDSQTDTVTVTGVNNGITVTATAMATVTLTPLSPPQIAVTKAAAPPSQVEPGGTFTFTVAVSNPSTVNPVTITKLIDNIYGDLSTRAGSTCGTLIGTTLAPGATSPSCTFTGPFNGKAGDSQTDTVTVTGTNNGTTVTATAMATVKLTPVGPQIALKKVASPATHAAPGGTFTFTATVSNPSTLEPVTITKLVDNIYGDLATRPGSTCGALIGVTLAPGASSAPCTFTGAFNGASGASQTDTITVTGTNNGATVTATAQATVSLTPGPAGVVKPAAAISPVSLHAPAACVSTPFKIYVSGSRIKAVVYYLDGKRIGTVSRPDPQGRLSFTIRPGALTQGKVHHLTAVTQPVAHSGQPVRTARRTFAVCAKPALPRFTG